MKSGLYREVVGLYSKPSFDSLLFCDIIEDHGTQQETDQLGTREHTRSPTHHGSCTNFVPGTSSGDDSEGSQSAPGMYFWTL